MSIILWILSAVLVVAIIVAVISYIELNDERRYTETWKSSCNKAMNELTECRNQLAKAEAKLLKLSETLLEE